MDRAYSLLEIKAVDDDTRVISGIATTPTPDRMGDVVEPLGLEYKNPLPLLWQHDSRQPIGHVRFDKPTKSGVTFSATLAKTDEPGALKERLDEAWQTIKMGLVRAVSIGFRAIEYSYIEATGGVRFTKAEVLELSAVTIPAQADAVISTVKSFDIGRPDDDPSEIPQTTPEQAAPGRKTHVAKLNTPARVRAEPFVLKRINHRR